MMKQQSDYVNAMVRQTKTLLQKAVMVAQAEAAGANTASSGGGGNQGLTGTQDCKFMTPAEAMSCLQRNMQSVRNALSGMATPNSQIRNQLISDNNVLLMTLGGLASPDADRTVANIREKDLCDNKLLNNKPGVENCLGQIHLGLNAVNTVLTRPTVIR